MRIKTRFAKIVTRVVMLLGLLVIASPTPGIHAVAAANPVAAENQQPGSSGWQQPNPAADDINGQIKGYASATSVMQNDSLSFYVSVNPAQTYTIDFYRMGWYQGLGGRLRLHVGPLNGVQQPACPIDATTGLIACNWSPGFSLSIPSDWTSGIYLAVLTNAQGWDNYVPFVVKDGRPAQYVYQQPINTYEAYNNYPDDGATGKSLYTFNSFGAPTVSGETRAVKVSFDRPYSDDGSGDLLKWELNLIRWLERSGYDVTYTTDLDTHENGGALLNSKGLIVGGHSEYWSMPMFTAAQAARDTGVGLAFFASNAVYWQVRLETSAAGVADRVLVCYKDATIDPVQGPTTTVNFRNAPVNLPEQTLMGEQFIDQGPWGQNTGYLVTNSSNWVYAGTGFHDGDVVPGIVGYEMDSFQPSFPAPTSSNQTVLSASPFTGSAGPQTANSSIYQAPSGAWVFDAGTTSWSWALDNYGGHNVVDARIQQATANILNTFVYGPPIVHDLKLTVPPTVTAGQPVSVAVTAENAQGNPVTTYSGTVHFASSDTSSAVRLPVNSTLTNGQGTFSVTLAKAGAQTLTVSDAANALSTTVPLTVLAAPANHLALATTGAPTATAGSSFAFTATALDQFGNVDPNYAGTVRFTSTDTSAGVVLPRNSTLSGGRGSFSATLDRAGSQAISGADITSPSIAGSMTVAIVAAAPASLSLAVPPTAKVSQPFNATLTALDRFGNVATSYAGTVHFSSSDLLAGTLGKLPADYTFTGGDAGTHTFSITLMTAGNQTVSVTDTVNGALLNVTSSPIAVTVI